MPAGLRVFDAAGNPLVELTTRITKIVGRQVIAAAATGSLVVPNVGTGAVWYMLYFPAGSRYNPLVTVSGATISWSPNVAYPSTHTDVTMIYGIY